MDDKTVQQIYDQMDALNIDREASQDETAIPCPCPFSPDKCDPQDKDIRINLVTHTFRCRSCQTSGKLDDLLKALKTYRPEPEPKPPMVQDAEFSETITYTAAPPSRAPGEGILVLDTHVDPPAPEPPRSLEHPIISALAVLFLLAGLGAGALSGFANYGAFSASVADPVQSRIWGWAGVIASVISFGGFTFVYWHAVSRRWKEAVRAGVFALAGALTSIYGTQLYVAANSANAAAEMQSADANRARLETQVEDWRAQLAGIPAETRSVEGLEAYLEEVERVGRTHQKPYRDAQNELGLAKRRDALQAKIETANAELLGIGDQGIHVSAENRPEVPSWFIAIMLELFSSQGTSIGAVALLILTSRRETKT